MSDHVETAAIPDRPRRSFAVVAVALLLGLSVLYLRAWMEARDEYARGQSLEATDWEGANEAYRHAVEWYAPFNPYPRRAAERLLERGQAAAVEPDRAAQALNALESLRLAANATRGLNEPQLDLVELAEPIIARLRAAEIALRDSETNLADEAHNQLVLLQRSRSHAPDPYWSLLATGSFGLWIVATGLALRGPSLHSRRPEHWRLRWGSASVVTLALWLTGLSLA